MREHQYGGAGDGEAAEHQREARRQRGCRQQHRRQEQKGERVLQAAGQEQEHREFGDVEGEQPGGAVGLQPLRHVEAQAQRDIEPGRQRDHREAGPDRQREIEPVIDRQHRGALPDNGEPAQPHEGVEAHIAARMVLGKAERGHGRQSNVAGRRFISSPGGAFCLQGLRFVRRGVTSARHGRQQYQRRQRRFPGQALQGRGGGRRHFVSACARIDHRAARRQWRRQDHDHRDDSSAWSRPRPARSACSARRCRRSAIACCTG